MSYKLLFAYFCLIPLMLLDAHLSLVMRYLFGFKIEMVSFLMLIFFFHLAWKSNRVCSVIFSIFYGILYDSYYLNGMPNMLISLPLATCFAICLFGQMKKKASAFQKTLLFLIFLFQILGINFLIVGQYHSNQVALSFFITYSLIPTLFLNLLFFVIITQYFKRFF
ncbi:rod shape-determining protein MreD [Streptococcus iniae]|uniref:Rod shape-determining protein MreD n=1 Tax=Streptococcus iniae TaxID=1346 RepID=A0A3L8GRA3_STRIN|nr:rod shape-determining protein MreD [Streptococcus iniae]AHY14945.1 rod shape-determining protein MreD [Streptococcus iniae]AHY16817.1 rod shape-determining protein MreD [Streptococcus iniae]AJG25102.1 rod shape-determining protein MreD [Streptococcus iniae]APD31003.1 rod shape-determining protein MreD [Streptococcus iniae]AYB01931.1 rod shape-determining protein MreD [Streptococcus iniae]